MRILGSVSLLRLTGDKKIALVGVREDARIILDSVFGMNKMRKLDYRKWKKLFVKSGLTLSQISKMDGAPSLCSLKLQSAKGGWVSQREAHRLAKNLKTQESEAVKDIADKAIVAINSQVSRVEEILEILSRIDRVADAMLYKPIQRFSEMEVSELSPRDIATFVRLGWDIKCKLIELDAARINWDSEKVREAIG